jgi:MobC-like protein
MFMPEMPVTWHKNESLRFNKSGMGRRKLKDTESLKYRLETRVNEKKFRELETILSRTLNKDMSSLIRDILHNRQVKVYTYDRSLDVVMEELAALRAEIRAIGVNINQVTRLFNSYPENRRKEFFAKIVFDKYISTETKIDRLLEIITQLSKKWL